MGSAAAAHTEAYLSGDCLGYEKYQCSGELMFLVLLLCGLCLCAKISQGGLSIFILSCIVLEHSHFFFICVAAGSTATYHGYSGRSCVGAVTHHSSFNMSSCTHTSGDGGWLSQYCTSVSAAPTQVPSAAPTHVPSPEPTTVSSAEPSPAPSLQPTVYLGVDDMALQLMDDMSQQQQHQAGNETTQYVVREDFVWSSSSGCAGVADRVRVTTVGMCFSHCEGCGSFKYAVHSRSGSGSGRSGGSSSDVIAGSGIGESVEVVQYYYADDGCATARTRESSERQQLGCVSVGSGGGMQRVSLASSFPSLDAAVYYVSRLLSAIVF